MPKYLATASRYLDGKYIYADVEHPVVVEIPESIKVPADCRTLIKLDDKGQPADPKHPSVNQGAVKAHFHDVQREQRSASTAFGPKDDKGRPSDREPGRR